ncbi:MAG TPA: fumarylacetoacetate hydrolase family protein, partial [Marinilabiliaceae bacterium]|nr:fumarylacetoacetate hydrolase family protein [Marinilabiliaceae bacterium]
SQFVPISKYSDIKNLQFKLLVNGETRQTGNSDAMIFNIDQIIAHLSKFFTLKIGDLIYTGTPAGVGEVKLGDRLQGYIEEEVFFDFLVK